MPTGIYYNQRTKRWRALRRINGKLVHLGYYDTRQQAEAAHAGGEVLRPSRILGMTLTDGDRDHLRTLFEYLLGTKTHKKIAVDNENPASACVSAEIPGLGYVRIDLTIR